MAEPVSHAAICHAHRQGMARNLSASAAASMIKIGLQLILLPVMARLLEPAEFGIFALVMPVILFFFVIADGGLGMSLAREDESNQLAWSTAFWALFGIGMVICAVLAIWGAVLAHITGQPRLSLIISIASASFLFVALNITPVARLTRRGDLAFVAKVDTIATVLAAILAVVLAWHGFGAASLAVQLLAGTMVRCVLLNARAFVRPQLRFCRRSIRQHLSTGSFMVGSRLADFACRFAENLLFGRLFGTAALGNYSFGNQVPRFLTDAISNPTWTVLYAQALHEQPAALAVLYMKVCRLVALVTLPVTFVLSAAAPQILHLVLGAKWQDAAVFIQILAPAFALSVIASQTGAILLAHAHNRAFFVTSVLLSAGRVLAVLTGLWLSPAGVAWALVVTALVYAAAMFSLAMRLLSIRFGQIAMMLANPLAASLAAGLSCHLVLTSAGGSLAMTALGLAAGGLAGLAVLAVLDGKALRADIAAIRHMIRHSPGQA